VSKLKNSKAPGLNGVPPEAFKAMNVEHRKIIFLQYVQDFFDGPADYESWHLSQIVPVPKSGDE